MQKIILIFVLWIAQVAVLAQLNTNHVMHTGRSLLYFGNYSAAIENFNMIIKTQPHLPEPYFFRGVAKMNLEDFRGSLADLNKAIEIKPFYPDAFLHRGMVNYHLKNFKHAMDDYSVALEMDGENADIFNNRGICKAALRDFEGAIADYTKAAELKPKNFNAYLNRSIAFQIQQEWDKALADCNQLIRIRPNSPMGYLSRGLIKIEKEDFAGAIRDFDMALTVDPRNAFAYQNRGMVKQQLESYESAIMDYDMALKIDPNMASAYFNRGMAKELLGRNGYQQDYDMASLLDPRFEKRPWQTTQEREEAMKQQMLAWQQQMQQQKNQGKKQVQDTSRIADSLVPVKEENKNAELDLNELWKRRMKANLVAAESRDIPSDEISKEKLAQNREIHIELLPFFSIGILNKISADKQKVGYFSMVVENLNAANNYDPFLTMTAQNYFDQTETETYGNLVLQFNERIRQNNKVTANYLYRGLFKLNLNQFQEAINDFDAAISLDERNLMAYFLRANARYQMIEAIEMLRKVNREASLSNTLPKTFDKPTQGNQTRLEAFDEIMTDYSVVLYMNPHFFFAYYNRGNIYCKDEKFGLAIDEYSKAIQIEPDFAEAYYNRGLVKVLLNDIEGGARDLSRAGELGIEQAYVVIKRYCN